MTPIGDVFSSYLVIFPSDFLALLVRAGHKCILLVGISFDAAPCHLGGRECRMRQRVFFPSLMSPTAKGGGGVAEWLTLALPRE